MNLSRWQAAALGLFMVALSACYPTSEHAIGLNGETDLPEVFSGIWEGSLGDGKATLIFIEQSSENEGTPRFSGLVIGHKEDLPSINEGWLEFEAEAAQIRGEIFLSALLNRLDGNPTQAHERGYYLFRVQVTDDVMKITSLDDMVLTELINRDALDGRVNKSVGLPIVRLTGDGISLRAFLVNADLDEIFSEPFASFTRQQ